MPEFNVNVSGKTIRVTPGKIVAAVVVILAIAGAFTSFFVVDQTEQAVVTRFGRVVRLESPGLHFKLPFGIEENHNVPTQRVQTMPFGFRTEQPGVRSQYVDRDFPEESVMLTGDLNIVDVEWIIQYRIVEPEAWLFNVEDRHGTIWDISKSVMNELVGDRAIFDVLGAGRGEIQVEALEMMNDFFDEYGLGITVTQVELQDVLPPAGSVRQAFEDVNRAQQDMNRLINEARRERNRVLPRVQGEADRIVEEARGYASRRVNIAEGEADAFRSVHAAYQEAPEVTRRRLYIETVEELLADASNVTIVDRSLQNVLPFLDLTRQPVDAAQAGSVGGSE